jgi:DNA-binding MarR family transcriptional regulator
MDNEDSEEDVVAQQLLHAFMRVRRVTGRQTAIGGLTRSEIMVLSCIKRAGLVEVRVSEISNLLQVAAPTVTQQLNDLESRGFVGKRSDPDDRRAVRVRLTEQGDQAVQTAWDGFMTSFQGLVEYLGEEDSRTLAALLDKVFIYFQETRDDTSR